MPNTAKSQELIPFTSMTLLALVSLIFVRTVQADSSVWRVSDGKTHLYLAGTVHILSKADYPLPEEFNLAYSDANELVFETEIAKMQSPEFGAKAVSAFRNEDGSSLIDSLSAETGQRLISYLSDKGIPLEAVNPFKPGWLMSLITLTELRDLGIASDGVDAHYFKIGLDDNKPTSHLESIDLQLQYVANIGIESPDRFVNYMLNELTQLESIFADLRTAWRSGDMNQMEKLGINTMQRDYPLMYSQLIKNRNDLWMPEIIDMLNSSTIEMVLVGALHLAGYDGLLEQLERDGYTVEKI